MLCVILAAIMKTAPASSGAGPAAAPPRVGTVEPRGLTECSGLVASRHQAGVLWAHTDGGGPKKSVLYAMDRTGRSLGSFPVVGAVLVDWEDLAIDDSRNLYIGDIGNNNARRNQLAVHRVPEPEVGKGPAAVAVRQSWQLAFPGAPFDCEALFVHQGQGYVISKVFKDAPAVLYTWSLSATNQPCVLRLVTVLRITSPVTGADLSPDGRRLGVVAQAGAYVFRVDEDFAALGGQTPFHVRFKDQRIEGCAFVNDGLLAVSEHRGLYLFNAPPFVAGP